MTMQILAIVVYSHDGRRRDLPLVPGNLNIITGSSKTGKSALAEIVNYCFGAGTCEVPEGPIRRAVSWFGLRLKVAGGEAFVARRCPKGSAQSSEDCFVAVGAETLPPEASELRQTTNTKGLLALLNGWCGIQESIHEPSPGQTRLPLAATVRHALLLCSQPQDEIGRKQQLFHGADDRYVADSIRDTLPYFLGVVDDDYVRKRGELKINRDQLRAVERQLAELRSLRGDGKSKAAGLLAQARDLGLSEVVSDNWEVAVAALRSVAGVPLVASDAAHADERTGREVVRLADERRALMEQQRRLRDEIAAVETVDREERGYSTERHEQHARLSAIGIFEGSQAGHSCPLCTQPLVADLLPPEAEAIAIDLRRLTGRLDGVSRVAPQVEQALGILRTKLEDVRSKLAANRSALDGLRTADERYRTASDDTARRAHVLGRIALYVESMPDLPDSRALDERAADLRRQVVDLEEALSDDRIQDRLNSCLARIGSQMTTWAKALNLEHSDALLRLDLKKLTVIADTESGPVPMARTGSAENWVGYHLISHLALHDWFIRRNRPVPRFLFLDQPSQVYFPPEQDKDGRLTTGREEDRAAVIRLFRLIFDVVAALTPKMQVVITEHADITEDWYQAAVVHRWRDGVKLVPSDWPMAS